MTALQATGDNDKKFRLQINANTGNATLYQNTGDGWKFVDYVALKGDSFQNKGVITTGDDLNNYANVGFYKYNGAPANIPEGSSTYGVLCVYRTDNYITQLVFDGLRRIYTRGSSNSGSTWSAWLEYTTKGDLDNLTRIKNTTWGTSLTVDRNQSTKAFPHGIILHSGSSVYLVWVAGTPGQYELTKKLIVGEDTLNFSVSTTTGTLTITSKSGNNSGIVYIGA